MPRGSARSWSSPGSTACRVTSTRNLEKVLDPALKGKAVQVRGLPEVVQAKQNLDEAVKQLVGDA